MIHLLHGGVGMATDWLSLEKKLSQAQGARALDLWDFLDGENCSLQQAGARLAKDSRRGDFLIAYSMGGRLALHALVAAPDHWAGAVIISAHPGLPLEERAARLAVDAVWARRARTENWDKFLKKWDGQGVLESSANLPLGDRRSLKSRREAVGRSFEKWSLGRQEDLREPLARLKIPILWLSGENDAKFSALASEMALSSETITHKTIQNAGHRVPWENSAAFVKETNIFLTSRE